MKRILTFLFIACISSLTAQYKPDSLIFYFPFNSAIPLENEQLKQKVTTLSKQDTVKIFAYADTVGLPLYNLNLAQKRAEVVQRLLAEKGIRSIVEVEGETAQFGSDEMNRRVEVKFRQPVEGKIIKEVINLNIQFVGNQAVVLPKSYYLIDDLIEKIKSNNYTKIELHGHVCCGPDMELSQNRAFAIRKMLINNGVEESIIECFGHSNFEPLAPEYTEADQEANRRVEVVLVRNEVKY